MEEDWFLRMPPKIGDTAGVSVWKPAPRPVTGWAEIREFPYVITVFHGADGAVEDSSFANRPHWHPQP